MKSHSIQFVKVALHRSLSTLMILSMMLGALGIPTNVAHAAAGSTRVMCENDPTLAGCWRMEEGSGTTLYDGGAAPYNDASLVASPTFPTPGKVGSYSLLLNGTSQYASVPYSSSFDMTSNITLAAWIKPSRVATQDIIKKTSGANGYELSISTSPATWPQKVFFRINGADATRINSTTLYPIDGNTWMHIAATYDGENMRLYINGIQESTLATTTPIGANTSTLAIGSIPGGASRWFQGGIDDARVYNRALTAEQIVALASTTPPGDTTAPATPTALTATPGNTTVGLTWTSPPDPDVKGYNVYRSTALPVDTTTPINGALVTTESYNDTGLTNGIPYFYAVKAVDTSANVSTASVEATATPEGDTTPPAAPTGLTATAGNNLVNLTWTANGEPDLAGYNLYRGTALGGPYTRVNTPLITGTSYSDTNLTNGTPYYYVLRAVDSSTNESGNSSEITATPVGNPPLCGNDPTLVGCWPMEEGSGTVLLDASSFGNNGNTTGSPIWATGRNGQALSLNGTTQYAIVPDNNSLDMTNAITLAAWVKPGIVGTQNIIKKTIGTTTANGYELSLSNPGKVFVRFNGSATYRVDSTTSYPADGTTWMHIAATYDGTTIRLYINGVLEGSKPGVAIGTNTTNLGIGAEPAATVINYYKGLIDDARVYNRALSASEIPVLAGLTPPAFTLSVSKTGTGSGTVTSTPVGINCGATCSYGFDENALVTLTAAPNTGSTFTGWSGICSGTSPCQVMMDAAKSVTAQFTANTPPGDLSCTNLESKPLTAGTGEKPQSKVWNYGGNWYSVFPTNASGATSAGTWLWKLQGTTWTEVLKLSSNTSGIKADVKPSGNLVHILLYQEFSNAQLVSVEYTGTTYQLWSLRSTPTDLSLPGSEIATIDIDSTGRMWLASENDSTDQVVAYYSDSPYSSWSSPITMASGVYDDDISAVIALPGKIGIFWSNQNTERFGFRVHTDGGDPAAWSADEVPASQSALDIGAGMADDHFNLKLASDGTLYVMAKTSYDTGGYPKIVMLVRRPVGTWDDLYTIDMAGTRPILVMDEINQVLTAIYTQAESYNPIVYRQSGMGTIAFGDQKTLRPGGYNDSSSTKQNISNELVLIYGSSSEVAGQICNVAPINGADLAITKSDNLGNARPGDLLTYTIQVSNLNGPQAITGATVTDTLPATLTGTTWTCTGAGGATCTASGTGNINDLVNLPVNTSVTYSLSARVALGTRGTFANTTTVSIPGGQTDPILSNNSATDTDMIVTGFASCDADPNLVGCWQMEENGGTALVDGSSFLNDADVINAPAWGTGKVGSYALDLNGTTQYALVPDDASLDLTNNITIAAWVKPERYETQDIVKKATNGAVNGYELSLASTTSTAGPMKVFFRINQVTSGDTLRVNSNSLYPIDGTTWMHIAATYDGATMRLYINGVEEASHGTTVPIATNDLPLTLGAQDGATSSRWFMGWMDDARVYNRALSLAEIRVLAGIPINASPVITEGDSTNITVSEDGAPTAFDLTLHAIDADAGDTLTWSVSTPATHGTATASGTGTSMVIGYGPTANYSGSDSFVVQVSDGKGGIDTITVNMTIQSVNDAPVAIADAYTTAEDTALNVAAPGVLGNDSDVDTGDTLTAVKLSDPSSGTLTFNSDGSFVYTPALNFLGVVSFTYLVSDGVLDGNVATVTITTNEIPPVCTGILYVDKDSSAVTPNGCTWTWAFRTLQDALAAAPANGTTIWVAEGTYYPDEGVGQMDNSRTSTFNLEDGVSIYGGFAGNETLLSQRDLSLHITILSGDIDQVTGNDNNAYRVVTSLTVSSSTVLDGFTITEGHENSGLGRGGGMYNENASPTLRNLIFSANRATGFAGGMYSVTSNSTDSSITSPSLNNVTFIGNTSERGGGLVTMNSNAILNNVIFMNNTATEGAGGGMNNQTLHSDDPASVPVLTNVTFMNNTAKGGGGLFNANSNPILTNVTISGNTATVRGGGIFNEGASPILNHVTISGNTAPVGFGGAMHNIVGGIPEKLSHPVIRNSILWGNNAGGGADEISTDNAGSTTIINSVVENGCQPASSSCTNVVTGDPLLVAPANNGGFTQTMALGSGSSAIDAADTLTCAVIDQRGNARPQGPTCDAGAYEVVALTTLTLNPVTREYNGTATLTATLNYNGSGVGGKNIYFTLNGSSAGSAITDASGIAKLNNVSLSGINIGTYPNGITASFAGDAAYTGSNSTADLTITEDAPVVHSIALIEGWNLVSFNVHPANTSPAAVLSSIAGNYDLVYTWDATGAHAGSGNWLKYDNIPYSPDSLTALDETMGFWIHMTAADTLDVSGTTPTTTNIPLYIGAGGWNLVGYPSSANRSLPGALFDHGVDADFSLIYAYHAGETDVWKLFDRTTPIFANDLTQLTPGWGYWVKVNADKTWNVNYAAP